MRAREERGVAEVDGAAELSRGGRKLQAAFARFPLAAVVRGGVAVDVGASTGGFTEVLLAQGARAVTAVEVGHGQMLPRLRDDARVTLLERTDWKTLALGIAPGPFDFFTVDVSFVAARSMLRSLAFRLRPGAEGVVLLKPQFELPGALVKGGDVSAAPLRARALASFTKKAEDLGFSIVAAEDSPVAGGEGTVEMLLHLRFAGRTARLPARPGEQAPLRPARGAEDAAKRAAKSAREGAAARGLPGSLRWFATAAPGLEGVVRGEVERLPGVSDVVEVKGGVEFRGGADVGVAANLGLRAATRVLVRLGSVKAREFAKLRRLASKLDWRRFVDAAVPVRFEVSTRSCRLYHTGAIAETLALAINERIGRKITLAPRGEAAGGGSASLDDEAREGEPEVLRVFARGESDEFTLSVDASGALLHRRGWRLEAGRAPLRETLAAGLLALAGYDEKAPLVDLMCGAGTIVLEAAARAQGRLPGEGRAYAFERWPAYEPALRARVHAALIERPARAADVSHEGTLAASGGPAPAASSDAAPAGSSGAVPALWGFDADAEVVAVARRNAARAGLVERVRIEVAALGGGASVAPPGGPGLVVVNPPYGRRLGGPGEAVRVLRQLGDVLRAQFGGWRAGIILADPAWARHLRLPVEATHRLDNGGTRVTYVVVRVPQR